ncbi:MAG: hypothetical protein IKU17_08330 [Clostridia bacterium]|nr:hypothetical protein [Clostridia bacterium]
MKKEILNRMLEQVDDDLLQESMAAPKKKFPLRWVGMAVAAALVLVLGAGVLLRGLPMLNMDGDVSETALGKTEATMETTTEEIYTGGAEDGDAMTGTYWVPEVHVTLVGGYELDDASMKTPENGEVILFPGLELAMEDHEGLDVQFVVAMDVFRDEEAVVSDALMEEASALMEDGYNVVELGDCIVLQMTAEEIENFTAERGGYGLRSGELPEPVIGDSATSEAYTGDTDLAVETTEDDWARVIYGNSLPECNCAETAVQPQNGEVIIRHDLQHGMEQYDGEDVYFFVAAELYKDGQHLTGEDALYPLIVAVKESLWNTRCLGGPEEVSVLVEVAAEQIEKFEAPEGYGVVLRFAVGVETNDGVVASFWWE